MSLTLPEALRRLHAAGRIALPWRPGLLLSEYGAGFTARVAWLDGDDGQRVNLSYESTTSREQVKGGWIRVQSERLHEWQGPVLTDAATVGVLMALLREAIRDPTAVATPLRSGAWSVDTRAEGYDHWLSNLEHRNRHPHRPTEGEAIAATLIAYAEEVAP